MPRKARARLLYSTISTSERVSDLGAKGGLIFTWLLAHADDQGRYAGSARKVKAEVVPLVDEITVEDVEKALGEMEEERLITRYAMGKAQLVQILDWWEFQSGLRVRYESRYPAPEGWEDNIRLPPAQTRDDVGKFKVKPQPQAPALRPQLSTKQAVRNILENGEANTYTIEELIDTLSKPLPEIEEAVEELWREDTVSVIGPTTGELLGPPFFNSNYRVSLR